jgi:hypothetical protein
VAVEEPRARVICEEPDRNVITGVADAHDVAGHRVIKVIRGIASTADYGERMPMEVNRMLLEKCRDKYKKGEVTSPAVGTENSQVRQGHHLEWLVRRSCLALGHRYSLREANPTPSLHRSGSGATPE